MIKKNYFYKCLNTIYSTNPYFLEDTLVEEVESMLTLWLHSSHLHQFEISTLAEPIKKERKYVVEGPIKTSFIYK